MKKEVGSEFLDKKRDLKTLFILFRLNGWKTAKIVLDRIYTNIQLSLILMLLSLMLI